jgi:hypothetical protein
MARVVLIHGIGQQYSTVAEQEGLWLPSLVKGVLLSEHPAAGKVAAELSSGSEPGRQRLAQMVFYGDLYLPGGVQGDEVAASTETQILADELAIALLRTAAARAEERTVTEAVNALRQADAELSDIQGMGAVTRSALATLDGNRWLSARIFGLAQRARPSLLQVARYLVEQSIRGAVQDRVAALIDYRTDLLIGHSLGSVIAWEAAQLRKSPLSAMITLGSPLGLDTIVYPRLRPQPPSWPDAVRRWVNVSHYDDFIAVEPLLAPLFRSSDGRNVEDYPLPAKHEHHGASGYLEEAVTGRAIVEALTESGD